MNRLSFVLILLTVLTTGVRAADDVDELRRAARQGVFPETLASIDSAFLYKRQMFAGGRIDTARIGLTQYLVIFQHGSGVPVTDIAIYRRRISGQWILVLRPKVPTTGGFLYAEADGGKLVARSPDSKQTWPLFDPKAKP